MINYLRSFDYFGHPALLHFGRNPAKNEDGDTHSKTLIGGLYSMLLRIIYFVCVGFYLTKMINATDNNIQTIDLDANWDALMKE